MLSESPMLNRKNAIIINEEFHFSVTLSDRVKPENDEVALLFLALCQFITYHADVLIYILSWLIDFLKKEIIYFVMHDNSQGSLWGLFQ